MSNEIGAEMAYLEANKLNQAAAVATARALREEEMERDRVDDEEEDIPEDEPVRGKHLSCLEGFRQTCKGHELRVCLQNG